MTVELTITLPDFEDPQKAANYLDNAIQTLKDEHRDEGGDVKIDAEIPGLFYQHEEWTWGDPCPDCGSDEVCVGQIEYNRQYATGEHFEESHPLTPGNVVSVSCDNSDCLTDLYITPASYLAER